MVGCMRGITRLDRCRWWQRSCLVQELAHKPAAASVAARFAAGWVGHAYHRSDGTHALDDIVQMTETARDSAQHRQQRFSARQALMVREGRDCLARQQQPTMMELLQWGG